LRECGEGRRSERRSSAERRELRRSATVRRQARRREPNPRTAEHQRTRPETRRYTRAEQVANGTALKGPDNGPARSNFPRKRALPTAKSFLQQLFAAKSRALASDLINNLNEPVSAPGAEPVSFTYAYRTGIKTVAYATGVLALQFDCRERSLRAASIAVGHRGAWFFRYLCRPHAGPRLELRQQRGRAPGGTARDGCAGRLRVTASRSPSLSWARLWVVGLREAKKAFVLLPRRWVVVGCLPSVNTG